MEYLNVVLRYGTIGYKRVNTADYTNKQLLFAVRYQGTRSSRSLASTSKLFFLRSGYYKVGIIATRVKLGRNDGVGVHYKTDDIKQK